MFPISTRRNPRPTSHRRSTREDQSNQFPESGTTLGSFEGPKRTIRSPAPPPLVYIIVSALDIRYTPGSSIPSPFQSPTSGRSPGAPNAKMISAPPPSFRLRKKRRSVGSWEKQTTDGIVRSRDPPEEPGLCSRIRAESLPPPGLARQPGRHANLTGSVEPRTGLRNEKPGDVSVAFEDH